MGEKDYPFSTPARTALAVSRMRGRIRPDRLTVAEHGHRPPPLQRRHVDARLGRRPERSQRRHQYGLARAEPTVGDLDRDGAAVGRAAA